MPDKDLDADIKVQRPDGRASPPANADTNNLTGSDISAVMHAVGSVAASTTLIATLLFYFGWARTQAALGYFGINVAIAHMSVNDLVLRSVNVTFRPLAVLGLIALVLSVGHRRLAAALAVRGHLAIVRVAMVACALGVMLCIAAFLGFFNWVIYSTRYPFVPILLAVGVTLVGYGLYIRRLAQPHPPHRGWPDRIQAMVLIVLDVGLIFWVVTVYASVSGQQVGQRLASNLQAQPGVVVYSKTSLGLIAPRVTVARLSGSDNQYRYRYSELRLLLYSGGRYFLLPNGWKQGRDPVVLLEESNGIRVEFYSGS
jgi:hypothetical protein